MPASAERVSRHHWSDWVGLIVFTGLALALWRRSVEFGLALLPFFLLWMYWSWLIILAGVILSWVACGPRPRWMYHPLVRWLEDTSFALVRPFRRMLDRIVCDRLLRARAVIKFAVRQNFLRNRGRKFSGFG